MSQYTMHGNISRKIQVLITFGAFSQISIRSSIWLALKSEAIRDTYLAVIYGRILSAFSRASLDQTSRGLRSPSNFTRAQKERSLGWGRGRREERRTICRTRFPCLTFVCAKSEANNLTYFDWVSWGEAPLEPVAPRHVLGAGRCANALQSRRSTRLRPSRESLHSAMEMSEARYVYSSPLLSAIPFHPDEPPLN